MTGSSHQRAVRPPHVLLGITLLALISVSACASEGADGPSGTSEPLGRRALLVIDDLPTDEPFDEWEIDDEDDPGSAGEDPDLPACRDLVTVDEDFAAGLVSTLQSQTFHTSSRGGPTSISINAHDTVYEYGSVEEATAAFDVVDRSLFVDCIARNVTPGSEDGVDEHVGDTFKPNTNGDEAVAFRTDAMSDTTFFGGNDNETGSDLIAVRRGSEIVVFQFVVSGQSLDFLGIDPFATELDIVDEVLDRADSEPDTSGTAAPAADDELPEVVAATAEPVAASEYRFEVTISSPYDRPDKYADAWRVIDSDGTVYGVRELAHDHADEQPFTRALDGVEIPDGVDRVNIEARDLVDGWSGSTYEVELQ